MNCLSGFDNFGPPSPSPLFIMVSNIKTKSNVITAAMIPIPINKAILVNASIFLSCIFPFLHLGQLRLENMEGSLLGTNLPLHHCSLPHLQYLLVDLLPALLQ